jgi:hypothetical protein
VLLKIIILVFINLTFLVASTNLHSESLKTKEVLWESDFKEKLQTDKKLNWFDANNYCESLNTKNSKGWRLPTYIEIDKKSTKEQDKISLTYNGSYNLKLYASLLKNKITHYDRKPNEHFFWTKENCNCDSFTGIQGIQFEPHSNRVRKSLKTQKANFVCVQEAN